MSEVVLFEGELLALAVFSFLLPVLLYVYLLRKRAVSRRSVLAFAMVLIAIAGVDILLLQQLAQYARHSASLLDDRLFASELSVALYLLPALFAGIGINMASHVLISHLAVAERRFDREHP